MSHYSTSSGKDVELGQILGQGGEGVVHEVLGSTSEVAKLYHPPQRSFEKARKLQLMCGLPPNDDGLQLTPPHITLAWPTALLLEKTQFVGYLMPRIAPCPKIHGMYNPQIRTNNYPHFDWERLCRTARNLASALNALHARGYVIGDVNQKNVLVTNQALVTLVDTDSFQVKDRQANVYHCPVGVPEYTPPELQGKPLAKVERTPHHDCFGLAVIIFQLLMEGYHPFAGAPSDPQISITDKVDLFCIRQGIFPYGNHKLFIPPPAAPLFNTLEPALQSLFIRCFEKGHIDPFDRPTASEWADALGDAEQRLIRCKVQRQHVYAKHVPTCPWCERERLLGGYAQQKHTQVPLAYTPHATAGGQPAAVLSSAGQAVRAAPAAQKKGVAAKVIWTLLLMILAISMGSVLTIGWSAGVNTAKVATSFTAVAISTAQEETPDGHALPSPVPPEEPSSEPATATRQQPHPETATATRQQPHPETVTPTELQQDTPLPPPSVTPPPISEPTSPELAVSQYWALLSDKQYNGAWQRLSEHFRATRHEDSYTNYVQGFGGDWGLCRAEAAIQSVEQQGDTAIVQAQMTFWHGADCAPGDGGILEYRLIRGGDYPGWLIDQTMAVQIAPAPDNGDPAPSAEQSLHDYWAFVSNKRYDQAWDRLTEHFRSISSGGAYERYVQGFKDWGLCRAEAAVQSTRQEGNTATVQAHMTFWQGADCSSSDGGLLEYHFVRSSSGEWLIDQAFVP